MLRSGIDGKTSTSIGSRFVSGDSPPERHYRSSAVLDTVVFVRGTLYRRVPLLTLSRQFTLSELLKHGISISADIDLRLCLKNPQFFVKN